MQELILNRMDEIFIVRWIKNAPINRGIPVNEYNIGLFKDDTRGFKY